MSSLLSSFVEPSYPSFSLFAINAPPLTSLVLVNLSHLPSPPIGHPKASYKEKPVGVSSILVAQSFYPPTFSQILSSSPTSSHNALSNPFFPPQTPLPIAIALLLPFTKRKRPRGKGAVFSPMKTRHHC
ncbi:hypothetical protein SLE2022_117030 [Rubroshorea leprosula]